ncbi:MAG: hypothetical protein ACPG7F_10655 [Aggregatilineales bacterium]
MIDLVRPGKFNLTVNAPVMPAAGVMGYADDAYKDKGKKDKDGSDMHPNAFINYEKLGAFVTNPMTYRPWSPARSTRVVPLDAGVLMHTGLPNPGVKKLVKQYKSRWGAMPIPVIAHLVASNEDDVRSGIGYLDNEETIAAIELGLGDDISADEAAALVEVATQRAEKPVLVRLPVFDAYEIADACVESGAGALVLTAPPRGTARDTRTGNLVSGRIYGPLIKPMVLRMVGVLAKRIKDVPIIGAGGIHSAQDARDYLEAGARAVQVDSVVWAKPRLMERIARDLSTGIVTRPPGAFPDEWTPDMGDTEMALLEDMLRGNISDEDPV